MTTILITGSNGQLGSEIKQLQNIIDAKFIFTDYQELDITDKAAIEKIVLDNDVNFIVNCAAYTAVDKAESDIDAAMILNAVAPQNIAEVSHKHHVKFIHISTDYVFDGTNYKPYTETDPTKTNSVYGESKLQGELNVQKTNPKSIIIRTSWLYSTFGNNFVKTMIRLGKEREELGVIFDQAGTPTNAHDLAKTIIDIINHSINDGTKFVPGIYHFSNEGICSWYDFAIEIHKLANINCNVKPIETVQYPTPAARPHYSVLNKNKIKQTFNITIPHWRDSLAKCIDKL